MGLFDFLKGSDKSVVSRREFLKKMGATGAAATFIPTSGSTEKDARKAAEAVSKKSFYDCRLDDMDPRKAVSLLDQVPIKETTLEPAGKNVSVKSDLERTMDVEQESYAIEMAIENNTQKKQIVQLTTVIPSGWAFYGFKNVSSAGAGIATTIFELEPGEDDFFVSLVYRSGKSQMNEVELISTYFPEGRQDEARRSEVEIELPH